MKFKLQFASLASSIDREIEDILNRELPRSPQFAPIQDLWAKMVPLLKGGKRIRGALVCQGYTMFGGKDKEAIFKAAAVMELIHSYLLIHDDIIDRDERRRGAATIHKIYRDKLASKTDSADFYGMGVAIVAGDILCHLALREFAGLPFPASRVKRVTKKFHRQILDTCYGELLDFYSAIVDFNEINADYATQVNLLKTAIYTFETPLTTGAILAGAKEEQLKALSEFAMPIGLAYQIQDDILGMFGDEKKLGKPAFSDLKEGKKTVLILEALNSANKKQKQTLLKTLGNPSVASKQLEEVRKILIDTQALQRSRTLAANYSQKARNMVLQSPWDKASKVFLQSLIDFLVEREK